MIHDIIEFRQVIKRHRALADRGSRGFSLAVFDIAEGATVIQQQIVGLVEILRSRARFTDVIGVLGNTQLAVLLPETGFVGARKFADEIQGMVLKRGLQPMACQLFFYPAGEAASVRKGSHGQGWPSTLFSPEDALSSMSAGLGAAAVETDLDSRRANISSDGGSTPDGIRSFVSVPLPAWKRAIDVMGAVVGLVLLSPVFLFVAALVKAVSPGPIFFYQERVGYLGRRFRVWKFRTMQVDENGAPHQQHVIALIRDDRPLTKLEQSANMRIIPFGKLLRLTGIDELPQLVNILRGEMSLVGPRPDVPYAVDEYLRWNKARFDVVPGLTGLWQVSGKNRTTHIEMMRLDIKYTHSRSFWLDFRILARTVPAVLRELKDHCGRRSSAESSK